MISLKKIRIFPKLLKGACQRECCEEAGFLYLIN